MFIRHWSTPSLAAEHQGTNAQLKKKNIFLYVINLVGVEKRETLPLRTIITELPNYLFIYSIIFKIDFGKIVGLS